MRSMDLNRPSTPDSLTRSTSTAVPEHLHGGLQQELPPGLADHFNVNSSSSSSGVDGAVHKQLGLASSTTNNNYNDSSSQQLAHGPTLERQYAVAAAVQPVQHLLLRPQLTVTSIPSAAHSITYPG